MSEKHLNELVRVLAKDGIQAAPTKEHTTDPAKQLSSTVWSLAEKCAFFQTIFNPQKPLRVC